MAAGADLVSVFAAPHVDPDRDVRQPHEPDDEDIDDLVGWDDDSSYYERHDAEPLDD